MSEFAVPSTKPAAIDPVNRIKRVLIAPATAFQGIAEDRFGWMIPFFIVSFALVCGSFFLPELYQARQMEMYDRLLEQDLVTEEQALEIQEVTEADQHEPSLGETIFAVFMSIGAQFLLRYLIPAGILTIGTQYIMGGQISYRTMLSLLSFSVVPAGIRSLLLIPLQSSQNTLDIFFSPAIFTGTDSLIGFTLSLLDVFDVWILWLLVIGISTAANISRGRALSLVVPLWLLVCIFLIRFKATPLGQFF